jgi:hypothetical protein
MDRDQRAVPLSANWRGSKIERRGAAIRALRVLAPGCHEAVVAHSTLRTDMEPTRRRQRRAELARRLAETNPEVRTTCWVFGCPPGNTSGDGLGRFCRRHLEYYRRHGHPRNWASEQTSFPHETCEHAWLIVSATRRKLPTGAATNSRSAACSWRPGRHSASQRRLAR